MTMKMRIVKTRMNFTRKEKKCHLMAGFFTCSDGVTAVVGLLKTSPLKRIGQKAS